MAFPTLADAPEVPLDPDGTLEDCVLRSPFDAGYVQTRARFTRARRSWGLNWPAMTDADVAILRAYEQTTLVNGSQAFTWTHPVSSASYTVQLTGPIKYARHDAGTTVSFVLQEV